MGTAAPFIKVAIGVAAVAGTVAMSATHVTQGPRLGDMSISAATYGLGVTKGWGTCRLGGNMIWSSGIKETKSTHKAGGKGFMGGKQTTFTYSASFAFAFAAGPCQRILRMWADSKIFYDETTGQFTLPGVSIRQYYGTEDQLPDPLIEADKGIGKVPGFRGIVYVVFENVPLTPFGNRIPNLSAEIAFTAESFNQLTWEAYTVPIADDPFGGTFSGQLWTGYGFDFARNYMYRIADGTDSDGNTINGIAIIDLTTMQIFKVVTLDQMYDGTSFPEPDPPSPGTFIGQLITLDCGNGTDLYLEVTDNNALPTQCRCIRVNPNSMKVTGQCETFLVGVFGHAFGVAGCVNKGYKSTGEMIPYIAYNAGSSVLMVDGDTMTYLGSVLTGAYSDSVHPVVIPGAQNADGSCDFWYIQSNINEGGNHIDLWRIRMYLGAVHTDLTRTLVASDFMTGTATVALVPRAEYDRTNQTLLLWVQAGANSSAATSSSPTLIAINPLLGGLIYWTMPNAGDGTPSKGSSLIDDNTFGYVDAFGHIKMIDTRTGAVKVDAALSNANSSFFGSVWTSRLHSSFSFSLGVGSQQIQFDRGIGKDAVLGDVVRDICVEAGLQTSDVDVTSLSDAVRGYTHTQEVARTLLGDLSSAFFFDGAECDDTFKFVKRGGASVLTVPYIDVIPPGNGPSLPIVRNQAEQIPRRVWVRYPDVDHDQQQGTQHFNRSQAPDSVSVINSAGEQTLDLRVIFSADEAKTLAMKRLVMLWAERESISSVGLKPFYMSLDPTDIITLMTRDGASSRLRVEKTALGADLQVQISGTIEDATLTDLSATGDSGSGLTTPPLVPTAYTPLVVQPEMPLLRDTDETHGTGLREYAAFGTYANQTFGGAALFASADNATWTSLFTSQTSMIWGNAVNVLPPPPTLFCTDNVNWLDVYMVFGGDTLETATTAQILNNSANAAVLITSFGEAEVLQFTTVTPLTGGNTYRLTGLVRGKRGSEWVCGRHHAGDRFIVLDTSAWNENVVSLSWLNLLRYNKLLGVWDSIDAVPSTARIYGGMAEKPYAPEQLAATRDGSDNLIITWQRRDRITAEWLDGVEVIPLNEATEAYQIDIYNGSTVVRTLGSATNSTTYLETDQTSDGLDASPITVAIYQVSATVGRGIAATATFAAGSGGGSGLSAPSQASAAGYSTLVWSDDFTVSGTIASTQYATSGYNWYWAQRLGSPVSPSEWTMNTSATAASISNGNTSGGSYASSLGGILTIHTGAFPNANLISLPGWAMNSSLTGLPSLGTGRWRRAYIEAYIQFKPDQNASVIYSSSGWPAFWGWAAEGLADYGFPGSGLTTANTTEVDFLESFGNVTWTGGGSGPANTDVSTIINHQTSTENAFASVTPIDSEWHVFGFLWTAGTIEMFVDNVSVGSQTLSPDYTALDSQSLFLTLGTGPSWEMNIDWVRVWQ